MYPFFESIKVEDQKAYLLDLHQERVNRTFLYFNKLKSINLYQIFEELYLEEDGLFKLRISYNLDGQYTVRLIPYAISEITDFQLINGNHVEYDFKYENRSALENLKKSAKSKEIIIVKNGSITDTSFSNLLFLKDKNWFTPTSYLLNGVQRQHLLKTHRIKETDITVENIKQFSHFQLINALNDFDDMFVYPLKQISNLPESLDDLDMN